MWMRMLACVVAMSTALTTLANSGRKESGKSTANRSVTLNKVETAKSVIELREMGPEGLQQFLEANHDALDTAVNSTDAEGRRLLLTLDSLCKQKDCFASRLYWYTDLEQAKKAAKASGKPILSLRLLGRLDEDLSCANSRFFRVTLYANDAVSRVLRDDFILHWESVRPVPKVTIDFGDGRKLERTLTGNSIHYVLDAEGRPVDALPGLYGPAAFLHELQRSRQAFVSLNAAKDEADRIAALRQYHQQRLAELESEFASDVRKAGLMTAPSRDLPPAADSAPPSAQIAARAAVAKSVAVERPVLRGMSRQPALLDSIATDPAWSRIAQLHAEDARLDQSTRALMRFKNPSTYRDSLPGSSFQQAVSNLERAISEDTVRDEYIFHWRLHQWFASGQVFNDIARLNEKVYSELFLTPNWDPWLGLRPQGSYSALDEDGVHKK